MSHALISLRNQPLIKMSAHAPTAVQAQPTTKKSIREWIGVHLKRNQDKMPKVTAMHIGTVWRVVCSHGELRHRSLCSSGS
jgi:hypothetical protein